ncbi:HSBP1 protein, partial [Oreocharis arfaki]|nr:HSBP1 protein [Oreocharis arfaki]
AAAGATMAETDPKSVQDLTAVVPSVIPCPQAWLQRCPFLDRGAVDDMSCRIDDLEKNIADLMTQAGVEELEGENKTPASNKG